MLSVDGVPVWAQPDRPDELDRIENSGGKVINWNGQRVLGVLATSRSIGTSKTQLTALVGLSLIHSHLCRGNQQKWI